eukprot:gnl/TRDRNA2_/TRDRNA2_151917_c1_seq1.p1 gnl/TRDRNA2_/TRDRNA2_151917_c1~~gnl/TRDRNA2_/TRDRNA2_151917_c1_seq1.p1  ORF type:complete len:484 (+),score=68.07 gnl/TRDRNA2_/TRDRNA2_151917_c1_seq1:228-1679(+)
MKNVRAVSFLAVRRGSRSMLRATVRCLSELLSDDSSAWNSALLLSPTHYPVRPVQQLEKLFALRRASFLGISPLDMGTGSSILTAFAHECPQKLYWVTSLGSGYTEFGQPFWGQHVPIPLPPGMEQVHHGSQWVALSRPLVEAACAGSRGQGGVAAVLWRLFSSTTQPHEKYFHSLARLGSFARSSSYLGLTRHSRWEQMEAGELPEDSEFLFAHPGWYGLEDLPRLKAGADNEGAPLASWLSSTYFFIRKVPPDEKGDALRDAIDAQLRQQRGPKLSESSFEFPLAAFARAGNCAGGRGAEIARRRGPKEVLEEQLFTLSCKGDGNRKLYVRERVAAPRDRRGPLVAIRIGARAADPAAVGGPFALGQVGLLGPSTVHEVVAIVYLSTHFGASWPSLQAFWQLDDDDEVPGPMVAAPLEGEEERIAPIVFRRGDGAPLWAGRWNLLLRMADDSSVWASSSFQIYNRVDQISATTFSAYFDVY